MASRPVREAATYFDRSREIQLELGNRAAAAAPLLWAFWAEFALGRPLEALAGARPRASPRRPPEALHALLLSRALVLTELGRHEEVDDDLDELTRMAHALGDTLDARLRRLAAMVSASLRGDAEATLHHARQMEAHRASGGAGRARFLADAADSLDRVGYTALAADCLERAQRTRRTPTAIAMAECALLARHGDPGLAEERLLAVRRGRRPSPREYWRVTLLRAYAAMRLGNPGAGGLAARAFEEAARLGQPNLPLIREREITESLLALACETGSPAALALEASSLPMALTRARPLRADARGACGPAGRRSGQQLLKLVAVSGGRCTPSRRSRRSGPRYGPGRAQPAADGARTAPRGRARGHRAGRRPPRSRPRAAARPAQFQREAREALALARGDSTAAVAVALCAIARYRGPLLPHDPYEPWADEPRDAARARC